MVFSRAMLGSPRRAPSAIARPLAAAGWWGAVALGVMSLVVHAGVLRGTFLLNWDDASYVVENELIRSFSGEHLRSMFTQPYFHNYAPLHLLSYALDHAVWGLSATGFLLTNLLLHTANGCLLYLLLLRLDFSRLGAAFAAAVFLLHPVQVESVAWVSERKNLLSMTFSLLAIRAFVEHRRGEARSRAWYVASIVAFLAAVLTKVIAVVVPPALVLLDLCCLPAAARRRWIADKVPYALVAIAVIVATLASQEEAIAEGETLRMDAVTTVLTMTPVVVQYVAMVLWPADLSAIYLPLIRESPDPAFFGAALQILMAIAVGVIGYRRRSRWFAWYALFFVGLVPVLQIVPLPTLMNDRYLYFPMLGAAALGGMGLERVLARGPRVRVAALVMAGVLLASMALATIVRTRVWKDDLTLWTDTTAKTPDSKLAWLSLGSSLVDAGRRGEGIRAFHRALELDPNYLAALNNLGAQYNQLGQPANGRPFLLRAVQVAPDSYEAHVNLGVGYAITGDLAEAERAFARALTIRPNSPAVEEALRDLRRAQAR